MKKLSRDKYMENNEQKIKWQNYLKYISGT